MAGNGEEAELRQVDLTPAHAETGLALSTRIGWNQALPDWAYMLAAGDGVGLLTSNGTLVASAMSLPYGRFAWICMVLVDPDYRRRGLATKLMDVVVSRQEAAGLVLIWWGGFVIDVSSKQDQC